MGSACQFYFAKVSAIESSLRLLEPHPTLKIGWTLLDESIFLFRLQRGIIYFQVLFVPIHQKQAASFSFEKR